jgi:hypothetical protein
MFPMRATSLLAALVALAAAVAPTRAHAESGESRSPTTATHLALAPLGASAAITAVAAATDSDALSWVALGTFVVGPSLGHYYAGAPGRGIATTLGRAGGVGMMALGGGLTAVSGWSGGDDGGLGAIGALIMVAGLGTVFSVTIYDVVDAAPATERRNAALMLTPTMLSSPAGNAPGMAIGGRF